MDDSSLERLLQIGVDGAGLEVRRGRKHNHPEGWEPLVLGERGGYITTAPQAEPPADWNAFLRELLPDAMNPDDYEIDGTSVEMRAWDGNIGNGELKRFYYFKARVRRRTLEVAGKNLDELIAVAKRVKVKPQTVVDAERTYWVQITDLQAGQADGDGVEGMIKRALEISELVKQDIKALAKSGKPAGDIFIPITGDLVEGTIGYYEMQTFSVSLDRRDQVKLVRRLLTEMLTSIASIGLPVRVAVVPGNHGENRQNGKAYTTLNDNDDVAVVEQIAEAFALAGISNVSFVFPERERLSLTLEVQNWVVGLTHGHIARFGGQGVEGKILGWFKSMAVARDPIGDSDILFTGHYHHARFQQLAGSTEWIQGGALCDASAWFSQSAGLVSDPVLMKGTITKQQRIESFMPHRWQRSLVASRLIKE